MASAREQEVVRLEHELQEAVRKQDRETLERLLAPGFRLASARGRWDRERWIETAVTSFRLESIKFENVDVTLDGDTAVVTSDVTQRATSDGRPAPSRWLMTDVWVKREEGWRLLVRHVDPLPEEER